MRITGGQAKGRLLAPLKGLRIRPSSDKVREATFNLLGQEFKGLNVLDLFAGTGSFGIEALSRGALWALFIDHSRYAINLIKKNLKRYNYKINIEKSKLPQLRKFFIEKRDFLLRLLENSRILEHDSFSELLMAVFHLAEELEHRHRLSQLPEEDLNHLTIDIERVYILLVYRWLDYMQHLKKNYPYLFSMAIRINPFNPDASPIVCK